MATDKVVSGCLYKLRAGDMTALGVLADRLEEIVHPKARFVRADYNRWQNLISSCWHADWSKKRNWVMWNVVASWHDDHRFRILRLFGWKAKLWPYSNLAKLYLKNVPLCLALFGQPEHSTP